MKKLLDIVKLDQLNACFQLELDFKTERHNLKRYLKSLKELKNRVKTDHQYIANLVTASTSILNDHSSIKKKQSELDYYLLNGVKPFKSMNLEYKNLQNFYSSCSNQVKDLIEKMNKYLDQSKQSFVRVSKDHERAVKEYAQKCFPQTTTILYMIGFVAPEKIKKIEDMMKQQGIIKETQIYMNLLNTYLDQMESLKNQATKICKQYYMTAAQLWIQCCDNMRGQMVQYSIQEGQLELYYQETGGAITDRSDRSNKENYGGQQQI